MSAPSTGLAFHTLTYVEEPDGIMVGRPDIESYAVLPEDGAALLRRLADGVPVDEAAAWYEHVYGESVDMEEFLDTLRELGFVMAAGERPAVAAPVRLRWLGRAAFSPPAWIGYTALAAACAVAMVRNEHLRPHVNNVFFTSSLILVQVLLAVVQMAGTLWHEAFHALAARRRGLPSPLGLSRRLYFLVFETRMNGLLSLPRRQRYLPFLAGILADVLLFSGLTLTAAGLGAASHGGRLALAAAYVTLPRIGWQLYLFLRTDLYYVAATALGCTSLHDAAMSYLRRRFPKLPGVRSVVLSDEDEWSALDRKYAPWYAALAVSGVVFVLIAGAAIVIPALYGFFDRLAVGLAHGDLNTARFWDSTAALLLVLIQFVVLPLTAGRRRPAATRPTPA